jgi:hypothetical protein
MEKVTSGHVSFAVALLAAIVVVIVVPAVSSKSLSAQHPDGLSNQSTSHDPYIESKFELATTNPSRDTAFYSELGFRVVAKTSYGYVTLKSGPVVIALSPVPESELPDIASFRRFGVHPLEWRLSCTPPGISKRSTQDSNAWD